jgi:uncharacterized protein DUF2809
VFSLIAVTTLAAVPIPPRTLRVLMLAAAALTLGTGLAVRALTVGAFAQHAGTALYACLVYCAVLFARPHLTPAKAGAAAVAFCWLVEAFQLTGVPAALSEHSLLARLVLGSQFDWLDLAVYPAGVLPPVAAHALIRRSLRRRS